MKRSVSLWVLVFLILTTCYFSFSETPELKPKPGFDFTTWSEIPIQDRGRFKPIDTFSRESVSYITGKSKFMDYDHNELMFVWMTLFDQGWDKVPLIRIDHKELKKKMGLDPQTKHFSLTQILNNNELRRIAQSGFQKDQKSPKERMTEIERHATKTQNKIGLFKMIVRGNAWFILPNQQGVDWFSLTQMGEQSDKVFKDRAQLDQTADMIAELRDLYKDNNFSHWNEKVADFKYLLKYEIGQDSYPDEKKIKIESHYNHLRPFRWSWIFYALASIFFGLAFILGKNILNFVSLFFLILGFGAHTYGFVLRCLIAGRPPVSNMYESVIWVSWGCVLFGLIIGFAYRKWVIPGAAAIFAMLNMILSDNSPHILDPSIQPLEAVLNSNLWLTIHVLTITLSYAAFALSLVLANMALFQYIRKNSSEETKQALALYAYRGVQIGVVLLAAGTILGGVWAAVSWGRFWDWDPKEVWALIALLLYLAVLHGRFTGWIKGFGFHVCLILCFLSVLMAWYGVNFVLGVGLHSYGFGTGGLGGIMTYVMIQVLFILFAWFMSHKNRAQQKNQIFPKGHR